MILYLQHLYVMIFNREDLLSEATINAIMDVIEGQEKRLQALEGLVNTNIEKERDFLLQEATSAKYIASRYNKTNADKHGFSTIQVATVLFGIADEDLRKANDSYLNENQIAEIIYAEIQRLRA